MVPTTQYLHQIVGLDSLERGDGHEGPADGRQEVVQLANLEEELRATQPRGSHK